MGNNITDEYYKLSDHLAEQGVPNRNEFDTILNRVKDLIESSKPSVNIIDMQITNTALTQRLIPHMVRGEKTVVETLSRLLRYIEQLEQTNAELRQGIINDSSQSN